jgi:hypothetical protein
MLLRVTRPAKGKKLIVELYDGDKLAFADQVDPLNARAVAKVVAEVVGRGYQFSGEDFLDLRNGGERELVPTAAAAGTDGRCSLRIIRRKRHQPASAGLGFHTIEDALAGGAEDDELEWDDIERLAVCDIDYHDLPLEQRPQPFHLEAMALTVRPRPKLFWISRGRGLHLVYEPADGLTAEEAAACGGLHVKQLDPKCTFEVLARTSYPPGGEVWE